MQVNVERLSPEEVHIHVDVERERLDRYLDEAYRRLVRRYQVPGFRVGRTPRPIFERFVGREVLLKEALDRLVPDVYREAIAESGVVPFEDGTIEDLTHGDDGVHFRAHVYLKPEVRLPDPATLTVAPSEETVTEAVVDEALDQLREQKATLVPQATADDDCVVRVEGAFVGEEGQTFRDVEIRLRDAFEEIRTGLKGSAVGDERTITYKEGERERTARFKVVAVHRVELPELDDDFARLFGEESLEGLRAVVRKELERSLAERWRSERARRILDAVLAGAEVAAPKFLVDREVEALRRSRRPDEHGGEEAVEEEARRRVRTKLVVDALLEARGIRVTPEEVGSVAARVAFDMGRRKVTDADVSEAYEWVWNQKLIEVLNELVPEAGTGGAEGAGPEGPGTGASTIAEAQPAGGVDEAAASEEGGGRPPA